MDCDVTEIVAILSIFGADYTRSIIHTPSVCTCIYTIGLIFSHSPNVGRDLYVCSEKITKILPAKPVSRPPYPLQWCTLMYSMFFIKPRFALTNENLSHMILSKTNDMIITQIILYGISNGCSSNGYMERASYGESRGLAWPYINAWKLESISLGVVARVRRPGVAHRRLGPHSVLAPAVQTTIIPAAEPCVVRRFAWNRFLGNITDVCMRSSRAPLCGLVVPCFLLLLDV